MGRKATQPSPGDTRPLKVTLSPDLKADLWAFSEVHHGAPQNRIIEKALRVFIQSELASHPTIAAEWKTLRESLQARPRPLAFIARETNESDD